MSIRPITSSFCYKYLLLSTSKFYLNQIYYPYLFPSHSFIFSYQLFLFNSSSLCHVSKIYFFFQTSIPNESCLSYIYNKNISFYKNQAHISDVIEIHELSKEIVYKNYSVPSLVLTSSSSEITVFVSKTSDSNNVYSFNSRAEII